MSPTYPIEVAEALGGYQPTDEQWKAISMPLEPYVLVAGAGSGKTSVMAARVVYLALVATERIEADHPGVMPGNVLALTFTNKATENLTLRIRSALHAVSLEEGEEPEIMNYHGFASRLLERHGLLVGMEPGQRVLTPAQRTELCARVLDEMSFKHVKATWQPSLIANILELAEQMSNHRVSPEQVISFNEDRLSDLKGYRSDEPYEAALARIELAGAVAVFENKKKELGVIDFGDQITMALQLVERHPEVVAEYRERFSTALLDEYQDTNVAQAKLINAVFGNGFPVTAVGDPDQNIYAWRGASIFNLMQFPSEFRRADGSEAEWLPLYTNFRSGSRILAAADTIISALPDEQRPSDKQLQPSPARGEGAVDIRRFPDQWTEAEHIATRIKELHDHEGAWSDFAILCRSSRLFPYLQRALDEQDVPAEFVDLTGLLKLPEIIEILAYARAVADPFASVALGRILLGPRYRIGLPDVARLSRWASHRNPGPEEEDADTETEYLFAEALEHLDEVEGISEEGLQRMRELADELAELRVAARRPVAEFLAEVVRRIGLLDELDADVNRELAAAHRRNISSFLDQVHDFSPVDGELTLRAFLDYVDAVESLDKQEWSPVQPSQDDSVKIMTIHKAKGLEFENVFVPGFANQLLPNTRVQQNPMRKGSSLDFELRGDAKILPTFAGVMKTFWGLLRDQELLEERRTCYVALTRAKQRLFVTGAWWYGEIINYKKPSEFFEELADWAEATGEADLQRGEERPDDNPLIGHNERFVVPWPGHAGRPSETDSLFPDGWRAAASAAAAAGDVEQAGLLATLDATGRERALELAAANRDTAADLVARELESAAPEPIPASVSVSNLITYGHCPKRFYWTAVRPLPQFGGRAAKMGTYIHNWIEKQASGQASLIDMDELPDLTAEELAGGYPEDPGKMERLQKNFLDSRFGGVVPLYAERPFILNIEGFGVNGRIDAIYGKPDGPWEVVDYKTGKVAPPDDPLSWLQLDLYALACVDIWGKDPSELTLTYFYVAEPLSVERRVGSVDEIRARVGSSLTDIAARRFDPSPGESCRHCDFLPFCDAGRAVVDGS